MRIIYHLLLILLLIACFIFSLLNYQAVEFHYYFGQAKISLSLLLLFTFILGALISMIVLGFAYFSLKAKNLHLAHQLKNTEKELANLRMSPIKDQI